MTDPKMTEKSTEEIKRFTLDYSLWRKDEGLLESCESGIREAVVGPLVLYEDYKQVLDTERHRADEYSKQYVKMHDELSSRAEEAEVKIQEVIGAFAWFIEWAIKDRKIKATPDVETWLNLAREMARTRKEEMWSLESKLAEAQKHAKINSDYAKREIEYYKSKVTDFESLVAEKDKVFKDISDGIILTASYREAFESPKKTAKKGLSLTLKDIRSQLEESQKETIEQRGLYGAAWSELQRTKLMLEEARKEIQTLKTIKKALEWSLADSINRKDIQ